MLWGGAYLMDLKGIDEENGIAGREGIHIFEMIGRVLLIQCNDIFKLY